MPIADRHHEYMNAVKERLERAGLRVELDDRNEKIGFKIREAQLAKIPYMLVAGDKEAEAGTLSVRKRGGVDLGTQSVDEFLAFVLKEVAEKTIN